MRKLSNCVISCLLCLICMLPLSPIQVFAAGAIDVDKDVHLKIQYIHDKSPVSDVPFDLYYVANSTKEQRNDFFDRVLAYLSKLIR